MSTNHVPQDPNPSPAPRPEGGEPDYTQGQYPPPGTSDHAPQGEYPAPGQPGQYAAHGDYSQYPPQGQYAPQGQYQQAGPTPMQRFFAWSRGLGVVRPGGNRVLGGVAAGLARRLGMEAWLMRLILFVLIVFLGFSLWFYIIAWIALPDETTGTIPLERWIS